MLYDCYYFLICLWVSFKAAATAEPLANASCTCSFSLSAYRHTSTELSCVYRYFQAKIERFSVSTIQRDVASYLCNRVWPLDLSSLNDSVIIGLCLIGCGGRRQCISPASIVCMGLPLPFHLPHCRCLSWAIKCSYLPFHLLSHLYWLTLCGCNLSLPRWPARSLSASRSAVVVVAELPSCWYSGKRQ